MPTYRLAALSGLAAVASGACGQPVATYSFAFGSPTGPNVVTGIAPGQTVQVFVNVSIEPGIGQPIGSPPAPIWGLAYGLMSISGAGPGSWNGLVIDAPYNAPDLAFEGTAVGSSVNGIRWAIGFLMSWPHPSPVSPDTVWYGTFTAGTTPTILSFTAFIETAVFYGSPQTMYPPFAACTQVSTPGQIIPIPAPATASITLVYLAHLTRRRR